MASNIVLSNKDYKVVGTRPIRHDGTDKVTGRAKYGGDFQAAGMLHGNLERRRAEPFVQRMNIRAASLIAPVATLSGGNQQKVVLAKWLMTEPRLLLCDEPTRGVDVGAKAEIYELMNELVEAGLGIVLISSELPELLAMSDRIYVMHRGRIVARFGRDEATQERIISAAMGE